MCVAALSFIADVHSIADDSQQHVVLSHPDVGNMQILGTGDRKVLILVCQAQVKGFIADVMCIALLQTYCSMLLFHC